MAKYLSYSAEEIDAVLAEAKEHCPCVTNPHNVTAEQVGAVKGNGIAAAVSLTREQYDAMQHDESTLYYVDEPKGTITQYKGDIQIGGSNNGIVDAMLLADGGVYGRVCYAELGVTGITLPETATALSGRQVVITPTITPENASNKAVVWSTDSDIITIDGDTVTAVSAGTATLTATTVDGGYTASCTVTIRDASGLQTVHYATHGDMPLARFNGNYFIIDLDITKSSMSEVYFMDCRTEADWYLNNRIGMTNISQYVKSFTVNDVDMMDKITSYSINLDKYFVNGRNEIVIELKTTYNPCILRHHQGGVGVDWMNEITIIYGEVS